ncbi:peptidoglycan-recognition protein SD-like isoform X2 [Periplaneta americana]
MKKNFTNKYEFHKEDGDRGEQSTCSKYWMCIAFFTFIAAIILITGIVTMTHYRPPEQKELSDDNFTIITRADWGAKPNMEQLMPLRLPVQHVVILHTATAACLTKDSCKSSVQQIQDTHMNIKQFDDIGYSFLVGGDGNVYEGRGWDVRGAFSLNYNSRSIGVAFIGDFRNVLPTKEQMQAGQQLVQRGVQLGKVAHDYKLLGHRQVSPTESPGDAFYNVIKTWPHWEDIQQEPN